MRTVQGRPHVFAFSSIASVAVIAGVLMSAPLSAQEAAPSKPAPKATPTPPVVTSPSAAPSRGVVRGPGGLTIGRSAEATGSGRFRARRGLVRRAVRYPTWHYGGYGYGYGLHPVWGIPPTVVEYPHPLAEQGSLTLGLDTYEVYRRGGVFGPDLPGDSDPYIDVRLPPFEGVVAAAKRAARENRVVETGAEPGLDLMKAGKFRAAGRVFAERFRRDRSPLYPLLLAEVFFALDKPAHAQLLLEEALSYDDVTEYLPRDIRSHFPGDGTYAKRVADLDASARPLVAAYFYLHSKDRADEGLGILLSQLSSNPADEAAGILYRHYLLRAFGDDSEDADGGEDGNDA